MQSKYSDHSQYRHYPEVWPVLERMEQLSIPAMEKAKTASDWFVSVIGGAVICFMTEAERLELHELKLQLPTDAQMRDDARKRIAARISARKRGKHGM